MNRFFTRLTITAFAVLLAVLLNSCEPYHSKSGSMKILRESGTLESANKCNDTTYYYSNNDLSTIELRALVQLSDVMTIKVMNK
jgi:hypothetical protein